ncbi:MAG: hypothetical protein ABIJ45_04435 [Candidatus Zixiibacteriota bacterium]
MHLANKIAILNSRQNMRPTGADRWVSQTESAVKYAVDINCIIMTSVGMTSWEVVLYFATKYRADIELYLPLDKEDDENEAILNYIEQFHLNDKKIRWKFIKISNFKKDKHFFQQQRDKIIIESADSVWPISIRQNSSLKKYFNGKIIDNKFKISYSKPISSAKIEIDTNKIVNSIDAQLKDYLIHWTRASNSPWPGETIYKFYDSILSLDGNYSHDGIETLKRILTENKLRASSRHLRKGASAVAFSSLCPSRATELMKWRLRYHEMSFEPYGLAIRKDVAEKIGVRKVLYGNPEMYQYLDDGDRPYFQNMGTIGDWLPEQEYRHLGNINLLSIPNEAMAVIVFRKNDIDKIRPVFAGQIYSLYD